jgi:Cu(I)/Ag(I) efflux system membrane protein CusA/SilA
VVVMLAVPFSLVGAVWLLWLLGYHLSGAVWVGMIALAGLDAETGLVMLLYLDNSYERFKAEGRMNGPTIYGTPCMTARSNASAPRP